MSSFSGCAKPVTDHDGGICNKPVAQMVLELSWAAARIRSRNNGDDRPTFLPRRHYSAEP